MPKNSKIEFLQEINPNMTIIDGFDDAIIGYCTIFDKTIAVYNKEQVIKILITKNNWCEDEAEDYFEFNIINSYFGELTPGFLTFI